MLKLKKNNSGAKRLNRMHRRLSPHAYMTVVTRPSPATLRVASSSLWIVWWLNSNDMTKSVTQLQLQFRLNTSTKSKPILQIPLPLLPRVFCCVTVTIVTACKSTACATCSTTPFCGDGKMSNAILSSNILTKILRNKMNANLMQLGNVIDVFLARHVSGTLAHHQQH